MAEGDTSKSFRERLVPAIGLVGVVVGIVAGLITIGQVFGDCGGAKPTGEIDAPAPGDPVDRNIVARGTLANIPEGQHVWVIVRDGNLLYPKGPEVTPPDGDWSLRLYQGGTSEVVSLELYRMGDEGHRRITGRLDKSDFSGIERIPGAERLDVAENLHIRG
jgi:hypothetical protein